MPDRSETWTAGTSGGTSGRASTSSISRSMACATRFPPARNPETAAHAQLNSFKANPGAYDPNGEQKEDAIDLDDELIKHFSPTQGAKQNSGKWRVSSKRTLDVWAEKTVRRRSNAAPRCVIESCPPSKRATTSMRARRSRLSTHG